MPRKRLINWLLPIDKTHVRLLGKGALAGIATLGSAKLFQFLIKLCVSRLGVQSFGVYYILTTTFTSIIVLGSLGVPLGVTRFIALYLGKGNKRKIQSTINAGATSILVLGVILGILMIFGSNFLADRTAIPTYGTYYRYFGMVLAGSMFLFLARQIFFGLLQFTKAYLIENIESLTRLCAIGVVMVVFPQNFGTVILAYCIAVVLAVIFSLMMLMRSIQNFQFSLSFSKELLRFTIPVGGSEIISALISTAIVIILASQKGAYEVGIYAACLSVISILSFIPQILLPMHFSLLTLRYGNKQSIAKPFWGMIFSLSIILVPLGLLLIFTGPYFLRLLMGQQYTIPLASICWLTLANICYMVLVWPTRQLIDMVGDTRSNLVLTGVRSILILLSAPFLTSSYGSAGIGMALFLGWGIESICCLSFVRNKSII